MSDNPPVLDTRTAAAYARNHPSLAGIFGDGERLACEEVGDGNLNLIFIVRSRDDPTKSILMKQALPYIRRYPQHQLTLKRAYYEASYYKLCSELCGERIPRFFAYDEEMALVIMENLDRHMVLRKGLMQREH